MIWWDMCALFIPVTMDACIRRLDAKTDSLSVKARDMMDSFMGSQMVLIGTPSEVGPNHNIIMLYSEWERLPPIPDTGTLAEYWM